MESCRSWTYRYFCSSSCNVFLQVTTSLSVFGAIFGVYCRELKSLATERLSGLE